MTGIRALSAALGYDACEDALASGASLSDVYALATVHAVKLSAVEPDKDASAISYAPTVPAALLAG